MAQMLLRMVGHLLQVLLVVQLEDQLVREAMDIGASHRVTAQVQRQEVYLLQSNLALL